MISVLMIDHTDHFSLIIFEQCSNRNPASEGVAFDRYHFSGYVMESDVKNLFDEDETRQRSMEKYRCAHAAETSTAILVA